MAGTTTTVAPPTSPINTTTIPAGATVTATSSTQTVTSQPCGCCSPCPSGYLAPLFSTGGLCPGAIDNTQQVYLAATIEFTPISPHTLAGYCLPSGPTFIGDLTFESGNCDRVEHITKLASCSGTNSGPLGTVNGYLFYKLPSSPYIGISLWLYQYFCGCNSGTSLFPERYNALLMLGYPDNLSSSYGSAFLEYVSHTCSPFSLTMKGTAVKTAYGSLTPVATYTITFTQAVAPFLTPNPMSSPRLELPCIHQSAIPIDRADCNCPDKWVYGCEIFGQCRTNVDQGDGLQVCRECERYEEV